MSVRKKAIQNKCVDRFCPETGKLNDASRHPCKPSYALRCVAIFVLHVIFFSDTQSQRRTLA
eukprot:c1338_g1_i1 orf=37-222(+)